MRHDAKVSRSIVSVVLSSFCAGTRIGFDMFVKSADRLCRGPRGDRTLALGISEILGSKSFPAFSLAISTILYDDDLVLARRMSVT